MIDEIGKRELDALLSRYGIGSVLAVIAERLGGAGVSAELPPAMVPARAPGAIVPPTMVSAPLGSDDLAPAHIAAFQMRPDRLDLSRASELGGFGDLGQVAGDPMRPPSAWGAADWNMPHPTAPDESIRPTLDAAERALSMAEAACNQETPLP